MSLFNFLKKKKKPEEKKVDKKPASPEVATGEKAEKVEEKKEIVKPSKIGFPKLKKKKQVLQLGEILKSFHISEKATDLLEKGQYVFRVFPKANKIEIKKAIENIYGVDVLAVNLIKIPRKKRRLGKISGFRKGYKKAVVKIREGQKIKVL